MKKETLKRAKEIEDAINAYQQELNSISTIVDEDDIKTQVRNEIYVETSSSRNSSNNIRIRFAKPIAEKCQEETVYYLQRLQHIYKKEIKKLEKELEEL